MDYLADIPVTTDEDVVHKPEAWTMLIRIFPPVLLFIGFLLDIIILQQISKFPSSNPVVDQYVKRLITADILYNIFGIIRIINSEAQLILFRNSECYIGGLVTISREIEILVIAIMVLLYYFNKKAPILDNYKRVTICVVIFGMLNWLGNIYVCYFDISTFLGAVEVLPFLIVDFSTYILGIIILFLRKCIVFTKSTPLPIWLCSSYVVFLSVSAILLLILQTIEKMFLLMLCVLIYEILYCSYTVVLFSILYCRFYSRPTDVEM